MNITVNFYAKLRVTTGMSSVEVETEGPVLMSCLIELACRQTTQKLRDDLLDGETIKKGTLLLVDGRNVVFLDGLDTQVHDKQVIAFFPPGGGG